MKIIVESKNTRRLIDTAFRIYGDAESFTLIRDAVNEALETNLAQGWVAVGEKGAPPDETLYPYEPTADEDPTFPWKKQAESS